MDGGHTIHGGRVKPGEGREAEAGIDWEALEREVFGAAETHERARDRQQAAAFRREADRIVSLILLSDMPRVDVEIAIRAFRGRVLAAFPEKEELFAAIYLGRFRRLWRQFRDPEGTLLSEEP